MSSSAAPVNAPPRRVARSWPVLPLLAVALCALTVLAGCSTNTVGAARTASTRSTVAADKNVGQVGSASANANFTSDKLRLINPCGLLDGPTMAPFGNVQPATSAGIDACIEVQADYSKNDSCPPARQLAQLVITRIRDSPPQGAAGSPAAVDPCGTVAAATTAAVVAGTPTKKPAGLYRREWQNETNGYDLTVEFRLDQDPKNDTSNGTPQPVDIGVPACRSSVNDVYPTCDVKWMTHSTGNGFGDVVDVQFGNVENGTVDACAQAVTAAKAVATKVPRVS